MFIFVGSISLPWSPKWQFYFLTLRFFILFDVALSGLALIMFFVCLFLFFLMLQGLHLAYISI